MSQHDIDQRQMLRLQSILFPAKHKTRKTTQSSMGVEDRTRIEPPQIQVQIQPQTHVQAQTRMEAQQLRICIDRMLATFPSPLPVHLPLSTGLYQPQPHPSSLSDLFSGLIQSLPMEPAQWAGNQFYLRRGIAGVMIHRLERMCRTRKAWAISNIKSLTHMIHTTIQQQRWQQLSHLGRTNRNRQYGLMKGFTRWRLNVENLKMQQINSKFKEDNQPSVMSQFMKHILNPPHLVLMLQQYLSQSGINTNGGGTELLLYSHQTETLTKFVSKSMPTAMASLETVTTRSILQGEREIGQIGRIEVKSEGITKICAERMEVMRIIEVGKEEWKEVDWEIGSSGRTGGFTSVSIGSNRRGSAVFYPLVSDGQTIGIVRQYFSNSPTSHKLSSLPLPLLSIVTNILALSLSLSSTLTSHLTSISYLNNNYPMKFIQLCRYLDGIGDEEEVITYSMSKLVEMFQGEGEGKAYKIGREGGKMQIMPISHREKEGQVKFLLVALDYFQKNSSLAIDHMFLENRLIMQVNSWLYDLPISSTSSPPIAILSSFFRKLQQISLQKSIQTKEKQIKEKMKEIQQQQMRKKQLKQCINNLCFQALLKIDKIQPFSQIVYQFMENMQKILKQFGEMQQSINIDIKNSMYVKVTLKNKGKIILKLLDLHSMEQNTNSIEQTLMKSTQIYNSPSFCIYFINQTLSLQDPSIQQMITLTLHKIIEVYLKKQTNQDISHNLINDQIMKIDQKLNQIFIKMITRQKEAQCKNIMRKECWEQIVGSFCKVAGQITGKDIQYQLIKKADNQTIFKYMENNTQFRTKIDVINSFSGLKEGEFDNLMRLTNGKLQWNAQGEDLKLGEIYLTLSFGAKDLKSRKLSNFQEIMRIKIENYINESPDQFADAIKEKLQHFWNTLCAKYTFYVNKFDQNIRMSSYIIGFQVLKRKYQQIASIFFNNCRQILKVKRELQLNAIDLLMKVELFNRKWILTSFDKIKQAVKHIEYQRKCKYENYDKLTLFLAKVEKITLKQFKNLKDLYFQKYYKCNLLCKSMQKLYNNQYNNSVNAFFQKIYSIRVPRNFSPQLLLKINRYTTNVLQFAFNSLKKEGEGGGDQNTLNKLTVVEQKEGDMLNCNTLGQISNTLKQYQSYNLYIRLPNNGYIGFNDTTAGGYGIVEEDELKRKHPLKQRYDISCYQLDLIWFYENGEWEEFWVKDRLNQLAKQVLQAWRNVSRIMKVKMGKVNYIFKQFPRRVKNTSFTLWRKNAVESLCMEQYSQNDIMYQMQIQTQTIKEKLKYQQKQIKMNKDMYDQIVLQKEENEYKIKLYESQMEKLDKMMKEKEMKRNIVKSIEKKDILKGIFMVWRENALKIKMRCILGRKSYVFKCIRGGVRICNNIMEEKGKECMGEALKSIVSFYMLKKIVLENNQKELKSRDQAKYVIKSKEQNESDRLMTFQDQDRSGDDNQKQNKKAYSNESQKQDFLSELNQKSFDYKLQRFKMNELSHHQQKIQLTQEEAQRMNQGKYKLNPKTLKFLKRMGKLQQKTPNMNTSMKFFD